MKESRLWNEDLAPVPPEKRNWNRWNFAALWVGMCMCIPSYMLAASLMQSGMYWWQALLTIALGNTIVLLPMVLNAHAGTKYGIPFPVLLRSSFGVRGANIPAVMRALVACGWFGIQCWIGGTALHGIAQMGYRLAGAAAPNPTAAGDLLPFLGITWLQLVCFLIFWAINMAVIVRGIECIKKLEAWAAPLLLLVSLCLLGWAITSAGGFGNIFSDATVSKVRTNVSGFDFWKVFFPQLTAMVGFWATLSLNIPDFTRYARSQRDQMIGQAMSLPTTMTLFSFIGITVTAATVVIFGEAVWDPVALIAKFGSPLAVTIGLLSLAFSTLCTNIAANVVSPANDFSNLKPDRISFKTGGMITGVIGILIMPWRLVSDLGAYIFTWLIGYGAMLGAIGGVMLADYYIVRKQNLAVNDLFSETGRYSYGGAGINWRAVWAIVIGVLPNVPGFLSAASHGSIEVPPFFNMIYTYAWFVALFLSGLTYTVLMLGRVAVPEMEDDLTKADAV